MCLMQTARKYILPIIVLAVGMILYFSLGNKTPSDVITIGFVGPLTGDAAAYGGETKTGVMIAVEEINTQGGINGARVEVVYEDGKCTGKDALSAAQKLVSIHGVSVIIGGSCSSETLAMAPFTEANGVLLLSPFSSSSEISHAGELVYRTVPHTLQTADFMSEDIAREYKRVAILTEDTPFTQDIFSALSKGLVHNGSLVSTHETTTDKNRDFRSSLLRIQETSSDALFLNVQSGSVAATMAKQARELGMEHQLISFFITGNDFVAAGDHTEGAIVYDIPALVDTQKTDRLLEKYITLRGEVPHYPLAVGSAYDNVHIIAEAIEKRSDTSSWEIKKYLDSGVRFNGTLGAYSFDALGDIQGIAGSEKRIVRNQKAVSF